MLSTDAEKYCNDPEIELNWAMKAYKHAEIYFSLLKAVPDVQRLKLTGIDDDIYQAFQQKFPDLTIDVLTEDQLKSLEAKKVWREFCNAFNGQVEDFNFATLFRLDAHKGYDEANACIVPRIQFLALEIARNRRGINDPELLRKIES